MRSIMPSSPQLESMTGDGRWVTGERAAAAQAGFTLLEVLVAVLLLSVIALSLTSTLLTAQHTRATSERWMQATLLAVEGLEQLRAGNSLGTIRMGHDFRRSGGRRSYGANPRLQEIYVSVTWNDGRAQEFDLSTLVSQ